MALANDPVFSGNLVVVVVMSWHKQKIAMCHTVPALALAVALTAASIVDAGSVLPCCDVACRAVLCCAMLSHAVPCYAMLCPKGCHAVLCHATSCHLMLCRAVLCLTG